MKPKAKLETEAQGLKQPLSMMTTDLIQTLVNNYRTNQLLSVKETMGIEDADSIQFDLATLKRFISEIETETIANNPDVTTEDLGIRFYYAAYPNAENWDIMAGTPIGIECAQMHTLVMIPTIKRMEENGEVGNYDFNPLDMNRNGVNARTFGKDSDTDLEFICQNHGTLSPPATKITQLF
ncbi:hypothetical protein [Chryseobacterium sp. POE27]|uniref:hypothetical protein n=1 Tax=Chryseobacterium sp. POE27 TaxID=3138177 RepID=UPI00321A8067